VEEGFRYAPKTEENAAKRFRAECHPPADFGKGFVAGAFGVQPFVRPLTITNDDWLGGPGNGNNGTLWSTGAPYRLRPVTISEVNWNDAAEDLLQQIVAQTPRPVREAAEAQLLETAERLAEQDGKNRVGVETVIAAWVANTPETIRPDLPRQMERFGLDPSEYEHLL
jgi:hypothetical protein